MKFHELACSFKSLHSVPPYFLSEQLTRISQCLFIILSHQIIVHIYNLSAQNLRPQSSEDNPKKKKGINKL